MKTKKLSFKIRMNGEYFCLESFTYLTLNDLLEFFYFNEKLIVLEYNGKILNPSIWSKTIIKNNDNFDIITIVGGG